MDLDQLLKESKELSTKKKKPKGKAPAKQKSTLPKTLPRLKTKHPNPVTTEWGFEAAVVIKKIVHCKNCHEHYEAPEPYIFLKKVRQRKLGVPDIHYVKSTAHSVLNAYSTLPHEVMEQVYDVDYCSYCFIEQRKEKNILQFPLNVDEISEEVKDLIEEVNNG